MPRALAQEVFPGVIVGAVIADRRDGQRCHEATNQWKETTAALHISADAQSVNLPAFHLR